MHRNNYFVGTDRKFGLEKEHFGNESLFMQGFGQARMTLGRGGVIMKYTINVRGHLIYCILLMTVVIKIVHTSKNTC